MLKQREGEERGKNGGSKGKQVEARGSKGKQGDWMDGREWKGKQKEDERDAGVGNEYCVIN